MKLYVDDLRKCPDGWKVARTITDAVHHLHYGRVEEISLDHDICFLRGTDIRMHPETFMPVVLYMTLMPPVLRPMRVRIHTANAAAGWKMAGMLEQAGYPSVTIIPLGDEVTREDMTDFKRALHAEGLQ